MQKNINNKKKQVQNHSEKLMGESFETVVTTAILAFHETQENVSELIQLAMETFE
jgi:hypothetical protein